MEERKIIRLVVYFANRKVWDYMSPHSKGGPFSQILYWSEQLLNRFNLGINLNRTAQELQWHTKLLTETDFDKNGINFYTGYDLKEEESKKYDEEKNEYISKFKTKFPSSVSDNDNKANIEVFEYLESNPHQKKAIEYNDLFIKRSKELILRCEIQFRREYNIDNGIAFLPVLFCENLGDEKSALLGITNSDLYTKFPHSIFINVEDCDDNLTPHPLVHEIIHAADGNHHPSNKNIMYYTGPHVELDKVEIDPNDIIKLSASFFVAHIKDQNPYTPPAPVNPKVPLDKSDPYNR